jgi:hypothetical protein
MPRHIALVDTHDHLRIWRAFIAIFVFVLCSCHKTPPAMPPQADYQPRAGDIIFQSLNGSELGAVIESATKSPFSHCGIVTKQCDAWMVLEAIGPVQEIPLAYWILRGKNMKYDVFRLDDRYQSKIPNIIEHARAYLGRPYDIQYEFDDAKIYCSELIFKAFKQATTEDLGKVVELGTLDWKDHEDFIRRITGGDLPLNRLMITPADLAKAKQLHHVYKG